jgi:hypothetical protein
MLKIHLRQCHVNSKYHSGRVRCVRQRLKALGKLLGVGPPVTEARCAVGQCVDPSKVEHLQWKREQSVGVCVCGGGGVTCRAPAMETGGMGVHLSSPKPLQQELTTTQK